jgi:hypothetical protein
MSSEENIEEADILEFQKEYSLSDLKDHTDQEWLDILKQAWGYAENHTFEVLGRLKEVTTKSGGFYLLVELHSMLDGRALEYPLKDKNIPNTIFIGPIDREGLIKLNCQSCEDFL